MKKFIILISFLIFFSPLVTLASEMSFDVAKSSFAVGEDFLVEVFINTEGEVANAEGGEILFPSNLLELSEVRDGNSVVNFWVEKPAASSDGKISFSGITTGGFSGKDGFLFGLVFHAKSLGTGQVAFNKLQILKNDGLGTKMATSSAPFNFSISKTSAGAAADLRITDTDPPEDFSPYVAQDSTVFDGAHFVVFSTVDKGSGMDHYEVRESFSPFDGSFVVAESPYLLKNQNLLKNIYVKAVDKNGNERLVKLAAQNHLVWLLQFVILAIILSICVFAYKKIPRRFLRR